MLSARHLVRKGLLFLFQTLPSQTAIGLFLTLKWLQNSQLHNLALLAPSFWTGGFLGMSEGLLLYGCRFQTEIIAHPKHGFVKTVWITAQIQALGDLF